MKNYPNQAASFMKIKSTLRVVHNLNTTFADATSDEVLGYASATERIYTFRNLSTLASDEDLGARIKLEREKSRSSQGALTFARELRRTLRDMGWVGVDGIVTASGLQMLGTEPNSVEEQSLLVEGLLNIAAKDNVGNEHHPVRTLLRLLTERDAPDRDGLELALEPVDDSEYEFARVKALYKLKRAERMKVLGITDTQRANALKIFPTLAVEAGLVVRDTSNIYSLSQDGWQIIGETPSEAGKSLRRRRGRRTTVGKLVTSATVARRQRSSPPRTLSIEEQLRAALRLGERTENHQSLVQRVAAKIGDHNGRMLEDEFSYDLVWIPSDTASPVHLFEMKTITNETDSYARVRDAVGQILYYEHFHVTPIADAREIARVAVFDKGVPEALSEYMLTQGVAALVSGPDGGITSCNSLGVHLASILN